MTGWHKEIFNLTYTINTFTYNHSVKTITFRPSNIRKNEFQSHYESFLIV